jgi:hypothetical protein
MNAQDIAANFRQFSRCDPDGWGGPLGNVLNALFGDTLKTGQHTELETHLDRTRVAVYTLFNVLHESDESCELHVLAYDDKPVGFAHRAGDTDDWDARILDEELFKVLAREMAMSLLEEDLVNVTAEPVASLSALQNQYLYFVGDKETVVAVRNPKWACGFERFAEGRRVFYVDHQGTMHQVAKIRAFANNKWHTRDQDHDDIFITINGAERVVDATQLLFELVPNGADLDDVLANLPKEPGWLVDGVDARSLQVTVLATVPYRWTTVSHFVKFESIAEMNRFNDTYLDHDRNELHPGVFSPETLGFNASATVL